MIEFMVVTLKTIEKYTIFVIYQLSSSATIEREFNPLLFIGDHYPKYVVSMDDFFQKNIEGVKHCYIADFLLSEKL